jgi:L-rhamnose mutarotase
MERLCFFIHLYEGAETEYDKRHDEIWPEMEQAVAAAGFTNYSLFRTGTLVVGYAECIPNVKTVMEKMGSFEVAPKWNESFKNVIKQLSDENGNLLKLPEVWHLNQEKATQ